MKESRQSDASFRLMTMEFRWRDLFRPPAKILARAAVRPGMTVLDFGCGPGSFTLSAARRVGSGGLVYAADIHPLAMASVRKAADKEGLSWIRIVPDGDLTAVADASVDVVLAYDVLHDLTDRNGAVAEFARVLKAGGTLSVRDHRLKMSVLQSLLCGKEWFYYRGRSPWTLQFERLEASRRAV